MSHFVLSSRNPTAVAVLALVGLALCADRARADEGVGGDPSARAANVSKLTEEAFALYKVRDYHHANEKFLQAFALDQDPNLLFNMARCYEAMGDRDSAIEKYEAFLAKPDADPQGKRRATAAIRTLRQAKIKGAEPAAADSASTGAVATREGEPEQNSGHASGQDKSSFFSPAVIVLGSGVVVAAVGAVAYAMGASDHNKVTGSAGYGMPGQVDPMTEAQARQLVDSGNNKKLMGGIALGVGGALLATSAILFAIQTPHGRSTKESGKVAFGVAPTGTGGQLLLQGRF